MSSSTSDTSSVLSESSFVSGDITYSSSEEITPSSSGEVTSSSSESSSSSIPAFVGDANWGSLNTAEYGRTFCQSLKSLIEQTGTKTIAYKENNNVLRYSDSIDNAGVKIIPFYHSPSDAQEGIFQGEGSGAIFNKEHVWPNSRGAGKTGLGADPQMLRPTLVEDNSSRGNNVYASTGSSTYDPAALGYKPARGECARILFYCACKYMGQVYLNNDSSYVSGSTTWMGKLSYLMQWNEDYPVTEAEKSRNEYLDSQGFSRNPFIDYPELANYIWDTNGFRSSAYI